MSPVLVFLMTAGWMASPVAQADQGVSSAEPAVVQESVLKVLARARFTPFNTEEICGEFSKAILEARPFAQALDRTMRQGTKRIRGTVTKPSFDPGEKNVLKLISCLERMSFTSPADRAEQALTLGTLLGLQTDFYLNDDADSRSRVGRRSYETVKSAHAIDPTYFPAWKMHGESLLGMTENGSFIRHFIIKNIEAKGVTFEKLIQETLGGLAKLPRTPERDDLMTRLQKRLKEID